MKYVARKISLPEYLDYKNVAIPSTSPRNTLCYEKKLDKWRDILPKCVI